MFINMEQRGGRRKGVTPVIAVILLMVITVVAAGGAFAFIQNLQGDFQDRASSQFQTQVKMRSVECYTDTRDITVNVLNSGKAKVEQTTPISVFVKKYGTDMAMIGNNLESEPQIANISEWNGIGRPNSFVRTNITLSPATNNAKFESGTWYTVEVVLPSQNVKLNGECTPS